MLPSYSRAYNATTAAWLALMLAAQQVAMAEDQCDGPVVKLLVQQAQYPAPNTQYGVLATFGGIPSFNLTQPTRLLAADPLSACSTLQKAPGAFFLVERGNCSFVDKYAAVLAAGGVGLLLFDDKPGCINMGGTLSNSTTPPPRNASQPPAISIDRKDGLELLEVLKPASGDSSSAGVTLQLQLLEVPALDASALLLWIMAVGTVVVGSLWSGADYALELKGAGSGPEEGQGSSGSTSGSGGHNGMEILEISTAGAVGFVVFSSCMLVLLYFFLNKVFFYVILVGFSLAGAQALGIMLLPVVHVGLPYLACRQMELPFGLGPVSASEVLVTPIAIAVAVVWAVGRNASWSWVLQDILGIAVMLLVLRTLRLPNLRVACVLLPLCFFYDVFWVFLQPLLTGGGTSVMVEVAGGGDINEFLPMLLRVPRLSGPPIIRGAYSLLGFGDVILPGLLVALTRRLDIAGKTKWHAGYYVACVMGYGAGLLVTYCALMFSWFGDQGQPALLYLVPSTLGVVLVLAAVRGELRQLLRAGDDWGCTEGVTQRLSHTDADDRDEVAGLLAYNDDGGLAGQQQQPQQQHECQEYGGVEEGMAQQGVQGSSSGAKQPGVAARAVLMDTTISRAGSSQAGTAAGSSSRGRGTLQGRGSGRSGRPDAFV